MKMMSPARVVKADSYQNILGVGNVVNYFTAGFNSTTNGGQLVHGGYERWKFVLKAIENTTIETLFDDSFSFIWEYSSTKTTIHNPNNFGIMLNLYEYSPKRATGIGPLSRMESEITDDVTRFPVGQANINTTIPMVFNNALPTGAFFKHLTTPRWHTPSIHGPGLKVYHRLVRSTSKFVPAGGYCNYSIISKWGKINSEAFADPNFLYNEKYTRHLVIRVECPFLNTSVTSTDAEVKQCGMPPFNICIRNEMHDVIRKRVNSNATLQMVDSGVANSNALTNPIGVAFTIAGRAVNANVPIDNE